MFVSLFLPQAGIIEVTVDGESYLVPLQNILSGPQLYEFPIPVIMEADEPPLTGIITSPTSG